MTGFNNIEIRNLDIFNNNSQENLAYKDTNLIKEVKNEVNNLNRNRIAGIIVITDGQIFDDPEVISELEGIPLHFIIVGNKFEKDRVVTTNDIPDYAIVGEEIEFSFINFFFK